VSREVKKQRRIQLEYLRKVGCEDEMDVIPHCRLLWLALLKTASANVELVGHY
jgi:hypothetical protein